MQMKLSDIGNHTDAALGEAEGRCRPAIAAREPRRFRLGSNQTGNWRAPERAPPDSRAG
jgi:hypothetical protein